MSRAWILAKRNEFVRDTVRAFCMASQALEDQFRNFDAHREVNFAALRDLVGRQNDKGLLWRLKDTAHHVFRNDPEDPLEGRVLDWGMGYIFHETIKLKEDAYQQLNYAPWLRTLWEGKLPPGNQEVVGNLFQVLAQTEESMRRETDRIRLILAQCRQLLPVYLSRHAENALLARFLFSNNALVRDVFGEGYDDLIRGIYGDAPQRMFVLASQSLRQGGWMEDSHRAISEAVKINPKDKMVLQEEKIIDNWLRRIKS